MVEYDASAPRATRELVERLQSHHKRHLANFDHGDADHLWQQVIRHEQRPAAIAILAGALVDAQPEKRSALCATWLAFDPDRQSSAETSWGSLASTISLDIERQVPDLAPAHAPLAFWATDGGVAGLSQLIEAGSLAAIAPYQDGLRRGVQQAGGVATWVRQLPTPLRRDPESQASLIRIAQDTGSVGPNEALAALTEAHAQGLLAPIMQAAASRCFLDSLRTGLPNTYLLTQQFATITGYLAMIDATDLTAKQRVQLQNTISEDFHNSTRRHNAGQHHLAHYLIHQNFPAVDKLCRAMPPDHQAVVLDDLVTFGQMDANVMRAMARFASPTP